MCEWRSERDRSYPCGLPAIVGEKLCILHYQGEKDPASFLKAVNARIAGADGPNGLDLRGVVFPHDVAISTDAQDDACVHLPGKAKYPITLDEATITGDIDLDGMRTEHGVAIQDAHIKGTASFSMKIMGDLLLSGTRFDKDLELQRARVLGDVLAEDITVLGNLKACGAHVVHLSLARSSVRGDLLLSDGVQISATVNLYRLDVAGCARLNGLNIGGESFWLGASFGQLLDLRNVVIKGSGDFRCSAGRLDLGKRVPTTLLWFLPGRTGIRIEDSASARRFWAFAARTFSIEGLNDRADASHYLRRVYTSREKREAKNWFKMACAWVAWSLECTLIRWSTGYGSSLPRLLSAWFAVVGSFGLAFSLAPSLIARSVESVWNLKSWIIGFQFSVTTFTTLGLGDIHPERLLGRFLTSLEAALGGIIMALTVLVIGRKFMR